MESDINIAWCILCLEFVIMEDRIVSRSTNVLKSICNWQQKDFSFTPKVRLKSPFSVACKEAWLWGWREIGGGKYIWWMCVNRWMRMDWQNMWMIGGHTVWMGLWGCLCNFGPNHQWQMDPRRLAQRACHPRAGKGVEPCAIHVTESRGFRYSWECQVCKILHKIVCEGLRNKMPFTLLSDPFKSGGRNWTLSQKH